MSGWQYLSESLFEAFEPSFINNISNLQILFIPPVFEKRVNIASSLPSYSKILIVVLVIKVLDRILNM